MSKNVMSEIQHGVILGPTLILRHHTTCANEYIPSPHFVSCFQYEHGARQWMNRLCNISSGLGLLTERSATNRLAIYGTSILQSAPVKSCFVSLSSTQHILPSIVYPTSTLFSSPHFTMPTLPPAVRDPSSGKTFIAISAPPFVFTPSTASTPCKGLDETSHSHAGYIYIERPSLADFSMRRIFDSECGKPEKQIPSVEKWMVSCFSVNTDENLIFLNRPVYPVRRFLQDTVLGKAT